MTEPDVHVWLGGRTSRSGRGGAAVVAEHGRFAARGRTRTCKMPNGSRGFLREEDAGRRRGASPSGLRIASTHRSDSPSAPDLLHSVSRTSPAQRRAAEAALRLSPARDRVDVEEAFCIRAGGGPTRGRARPRLICQAACGRDVWMRRPILLRGVEVAGGGIRSQSPWNEFRAPSVERRPLYAKSAEPAFRGRGPRQHGAPIWATTARRVSRPHGNGFES